MENGRMNFFKNLAAALLVVMVAVLSMAAPLRAAEAAEHIVLVVGEGEMMVDGTPVSVEDAVPVNNNGRVYIPLRAVAEAFGADVDYDGATGDITITNGTSTVIMNTLASVYTVNGSLKWMDIAPYVNSEGRTMVPVRFVSDGLGYGVEAAQGEAGYTIDLTRTSAEA